MASADIRRWVPIVVLSTFLSIFVRSWILGYSSLVGAGSLDARPQSELDPWIYSYSVGAGSLDTRPQSELDPRILVLSRRSIPGYSSKDVSRSQEVYSSCTAHCITKLQCVYPCIPLLYCMYYWICTLGLRFHWNNRHFISVTKLWI